LVPVLPVIAVMVKLAPEAKVVIFVVVGVMVLMGCSAYHFEKMHISFQVPNIALSYPCAVCGEIDVTIIILVHFLPVQHPTADE